MSSNRALLLLLIALMGLSLCTYGQEDRFRIRLLLLDSLTQQPLANFPIEVLPFGRKVKSDKMGRILLNMNRGDYQLDIDSYPYHPQRVAIHLQRDTSLTIILGSDFTNRLLQQVEVIAHKSLNETSSSIDQIDIRQLHYLPTMVGERDIMKALALQSGVTSSAEGAADIQVRGGTNGQNLILLDGVPLYTTQHLFGMVSALNPLSVNKIDLYKADFPARYGGKLSSVLDIGSTNAHLSAYKGNIEIGLLSSKGDMHIPIVRDKLGFYLGGRISNYSLIGLFSPLLMEGKSSLMMFFADLNSHLYWKINENDQLKLSYFINSDYWGGSQEDQGYLTSFAIGNTQQNIALQWDKKINSKVSNTLRGYVDHYCFNYNNSVSSSLMDKKSHLLASDVSSAAITNNFKAQLHPKVQLEAGMSLLCYRLNATPDKGTATELASPYSSAVSYMGCADVYSEVDYAPMANQHLIAGIRVSNTITRDQVFLSLEPRLSYHIKLNHNYALSASVSRMSQPLHRVSNSGLGIPFEIFLPSSSTLEPEISWVFSLGGSKEWGWTEANLSIKADLWYKRMNGLTELQDGYAIQGLLDQQSGMIDQASTFVTQGRGEAYGMDISGYFNHKKLYIGLEYTLMQATNQFDDLNLGRAFAASTDHRHSLSLTATWKISSRLSISANWQYITGKPITIPTHIFASPNPNLATGSYALKEDAFVYVTTERNNYRMRDFHKLDISLTKNFLIAGRFSSSFSIGVYNLYNRSNPYLYYLSSESKDGAQKRPALYMLSLLPILPSASFSIQF